MKKKEKYTSMQGHNSKRDKTEKNVHESHMNRYYPIWIIRKNQKEYRLIKEKSRTIRPNQEYLYNIHITEVLETEEKECEVRTRNLMDLKGIRQS